MKKNIVKYNYFGGKCIKVISINEELMEETYYFDYEDFKSNIVDLVELITGSTDYKLVKIK